MSGETLATVPRWAELGAALAALLAELGGESPRLELPRLGLWLFDEEGTAPTLDPERVRAAARSDELLVQPEGCYVPLAGPSGQVFGALIVHADDAALAGAGRRTLLALARFLGGALELRAARAELARERERRQTKCDGLRELGLVLARTCPRCGRCFEERVESCEVDRDALSPPEPLPYRVAGRYRLVRHLGESARGRLFRAHDEQLGSDVALKLGRAQRSESGAGGLARAELEAHALLHLEHPGLARILDQGETEDGLRFVVREWLAAGLDLRAVLRARGPGTPPEVAQLLRQAAAALAALHRASFLHAGVKPENVFLVPAPGAELGVKLLDCGVGQQPLAHAAGARDGVTFAEASYAAPEQLCGDAIDRRADLYALAAVGYEALTGRAPLPRRPLACAAAQIALTPPPVSDLLPDAPAAIDRAFARALARRPAERPSDVEEWVAGFVDALERLPAGCQGWAALLRGDAPAQAVVPAQPTDVTLANASRSALERAAAAIEPRVVVGHEEPWHDDARTRVARVAPVAIVGAATGVGFDDGAKTVVGLGPVAPGPAPLGSDGRGSSAADPAAAAPLGPEGRGSSAADPAAAAPLPRLPTMEADLPAEPAPLETFQVLELEGPPAPPSDDADGQGEVDE